MVDLSNVKGPKSDTIEFISCIHNPSKPQPRMASGGKIIPCYQIVGYKIKLLEDTLVPDSKYRPNAKEFDDVELPVTQTMHSAGEIVDLTVYDMILLISKEEYNGYITGGKIPLKLSMLNLKGYPNPRPTVRGADKSLGSIKVITEPCAEGYSKNWHPFPWAEEKFGGLFTNKQPKTAKENVNKPNAHAEALRKLYANTMI